MGKEKSDMSMDNFNVESFVAADGKLFLKLSHEGEIVGGGYFTLQYYKQFFGMLEIVLKKLIDKGLAEPLDTELEQVPAQDGPGWH
jgi:hypothetical protein